MLSDKLPKGVQHLFNVVKIGKCYVATCKRCSWRKPFMSFPITRATHCKLSLHKEHHEDFGDYVESLQATPEPIAYDGPES